MSLRSHPSVAVRDRAVLHRGDVFDLVRQTVELPSGLRQQLDLVEHPGAVAIAARDASGRLLVVRQYRPAAGDWTLEIPAGRLEAGEEPQEAAARELEEETGRRAAKLCLWSRFLPAPGFASEVVHLFAAEGLRELADGGRAGDDDEEIEVLWRSPQELLAGSPLDGKTMIAALSCLGGRWPACE